MNRTLLLILLLSASLGTPAVTPTDSVYEAYPRYRDPNIQNRRFKHRDVVSVLSELPSAFRQKIAGYSVEGRSIHLISIGEGPTDVLLWSQMHGDEPTATMAIMDLFRFFRASDEFDPLRETILSKCTLHFIPMLNPDGAERFQRRNANGVDLNRDAIRLQNPESKLLKSVRDSLDADWGFNLHDQSRYYSAGYGDAGVASISFLAPAFNYRKSISDKREDAMQLIGWMNRTLQNYLPGQVAKYNDAFEPRAFGDNIQKWGTRTILIESGGLKDDPEKQELRRLNFTILLRAFEGIATGKYESVPAQEYHQLPFNGYNAYHDLILREIQFPRNGESYLLDLAFRRQEEEYNNHRDFYPVGSISDIGDLTTINTLGYVELQGSGLVAEHARVYPQAIAHATQIKGIDLWAQAQKGVLLYRLTDHPPREARFHQIPIRFLGSDQPYEPQIQIGGNPTLLLKRGDHLEYVVVNGYLYDLRKGEEAFHRFIEKAF